MSDSCDSDTSEAIVMEIRMQQAPIPEGDVQQAVHTPVLEQLDAVKKRKIVVASGWTESYGRWWQEQSNGSGGTILFGAQLIGDARTPKEFTIMSFSDLACCSKWGQNRVNQHFSKDQPLQLLLPVLTAPDTVHQAVAGMLHGQLTLSASNVEAIIVLANAVGFEPLETACVHYLTSQAQRMKGQAVMCLAHLGDHLGLPKLFDDAIDALIQKPWVGNMQHIAQILTMPIFQQDTAKIDRLLHLPGRGAFTELQVLELLEMVNMPENSIASILRMNTMTSAELDTLLGILTNTKHAPGLLLSKAVKQYRLPENLRTEPDWSAHVRILHHIMMPDAGTWTDIKIPHSKLYLELDHVRENGTAQCHLILWPDDDVSLAESFQYAKLFALHEYAPYVKQSVGLRTRSCLGDQGISCRKYISRLGELYPDGYTGPFTIGVWWQERAKQ